MRAKGEVIRRNAGLQCCKHENLLVPRDLEDRAAAVADIQVLLAVKRDPSGDAHALGVSGHSSIGSHAIHRPVIARRSVHLSFAVECNRGRIHHLRHEWFDCVIGVNLENCHRHFLSPRTGEGHINVPLCIQRGAGDRMQALRDGDSNL